MSYKRRSNKLYTIDFLGKNEGEFCSFSEKQLFSTANTAQCGNKMITEQRIAVKKCNLFGKLQVLPSECGKPCGKCSKLFPQSSNQKQKGNDTVGPKQVNGGDDGIGPKMHALPVGRNAKGHQQAAVWRVTNHGVWDAVFVGSRGLDAPLPGGRDWLV